MIVLRVCNISYREAKEVDLHLEWRRLRYLQRLTYHDAIDHRDYEEAQRIFLNEFYNRKEMFKDVQQFSMSEV